MPREGKKSVTANLRRRYPDAVWLQGAELHRSKSGVVHEWAPLATPAAVVPAVITAIREQQMRDQGLGHTLVFCQDVASVDAMFDALQEVLLLPTSWSCSIFFTHVCLFVLWVSCVCRRTVAQAVADPAGAQPCACVLPRCGVCGCKVRCHCRR
jgi:hypothetical protein